MTNASNDPDIVHWHGLAIDSLNDGAMEEGSPMIGRRADASLHVYAAGRAGTRWYHTHAAAYGNLYRGNLQRAIRLSAGGRQGERCRTTTRRSISPFITGSRRSFPWWKRCATQSANMPLTTGSDVGYKYATINAHMLGAGEPIRVKQGQRVLMRLLNASATENVVLALPGPQLHDRRDGRQSGSAPEAAWRCCRWRWPSAWTRSWR